MTGSVFGDSGDTDMEAAVVVLGIGVRLSSRVGRTRAGWAGGGIGVSIVALRGVDRLLPVEERLKSSS